MATKSIFKNIMISDKQEAKKFVSAIEKSEKINKKKKGKIKMKDKGHFYTSLIKSGIRIASCIYLIFTGNIVAFAIGFGAAEVVGIAEEILDGR